MKNSKEGFTIKDGLRYRVNKYGVVVGIGVPVENESTEELPVGATKKPVTPKHDKKASIADKFRAINEETAKALKASKKKSGQK